LQKKPANINAAQARQRAEQRRSNLQMISFRLPAALFAANSYELSSSARNEIKNIAERIKRYKYKSVIVEGHTDSSGNRESNISLSQDRAIMVYYELYQNGIEALDYEGFGDSFPIASNDSAEGRELNRRVEIFVEIDNEN
jgi:outer membrane protein OmpA-like peptidoglycan-associated protein